MTHYYDEKPQGEIIEETFEDKFYDRIFSFVSASGLFSKKHVDLASKLLINKCDLENCETILDLGCGWGPVVTVLSAVNPTKEFFASDINERALTYTRKNLKKNNARAKLSKSNILKTYIGKKFDCILTNPPYVAGREVCYQFIIDSFDHLNEGGSLQLVARHQKGGKMLAKKMEEVFSNVEDIAKKSGFRIYKSVKNSK
ncbi:MAG: methyltransferase [Patescibacteria group bacterium]|nr:methyltransferase [Patescibacteria group bacterium]